MKVLLTGAAGFIGYHLAQRLLRDGHTVVGVDSLNHYYDVTLKHARLAELGVQATRVVPDQPVASATHPGFVFVQSHMEDAHLLTDIVRDHPVDRICHLAAQAGVRYSTINPRAYVDANIVGFLTVLELARHFPIEHLVYGSSSSIYGERSDPPFRTSDPVAKPVSLYAATKASNELMAHSYCHLYDVAATGLRFFTVYGPYGRPDMAYFKFVRSILEGTPIDVYNNGDMARDFTFVDDIVEGVVRVLSGAPRGHHVYNIGNGSPVRLLDFIGAIERACGREADKNFLPMQLGDVSQTWADCEGLADDFGFRPSTPLSTGVEAFVAWYRRYYGC